MWNLEYAFSHIMAYFPFAKGIPAKLLFEQECRRRRTCGGALVDIAGKRYPDSSICQRRRHYERKHRRQPEGQGLDVTETNLYTAWVCQITVCIMNRLLHSKVVYEYPVLASSPLRKQNRAKRRWEDQPEWLELWELEDELVFPHCGCESLVFDSPF